VEEEMGEEEGRWTAGYVDVELVGGVALDHAEQLEVEEHDDGRVGEDLR
jgi:hypothetical protein